MKNILNYILLGLASILITACGGGNGNGDFVPGPGGGTGGALSAIAATANVDSINADGSETATITAIARDAAGAVLAGETINFSSDSGVVSPTSVTTDSNGNAVATLTTGNNSAARTIIITATSGNISGSTSVDVVPVPTALTITSNVASIANDGSEVATITALALDANNSLLQGVPVSFSASSGGLQGNNPVSTNANGEALITLTNGGDASTRDITVTATTSSLTANMVVSVVASIPTDPVPATLALLASSPQLASDGSETVLLTAIVRDSSNIVLENVSVVFASNSGALSNVENLTDANGIATAELTTAGDPINRQITVTAVSGNLESDVVVEVFGSELSANGPGNLPIGDSALYTIFLRDSAGSGIANQEVTISSSAGNQLSTTTLTTDASGNGSFEVTATQAGSDSVQIMSLGETTEIEITVSADEYEFISPAEGLEIPLNTSQEFTVQWAQAGIPVVGELITFDNTRGTMTPANGQVLTDANGRAAVTIEASDIGALTLSATTPTGLTTSISADFVSLANPATVELQASPQSVQVNGSSTIVAVVKDVAGNPVKNQTLQFTLDDVSGGSLSESVATTDTFGQATIVYTAGPIPSTQNGVTITAAVGGISEMVTLSVNGVAIDVIVGSDFNVDISVPTRYRVTFSVSVKDGAGNPAANTDVTLRLEPLEYIKGYWFVPVGGDAWVKSTQARCTAEILGVNNQLDPGEDINGNGTWDPGLIPTLLPGNSLVTDQDGLAFVVVDYPANYGSWAEYALEASTLVGSSEGQANSTFILSVPASVVNDVNATPPFATSQFGIGPNCTDTN